MSRVIVGVIAFLICWSSVQAAKSKTSGGDTIAGYQRIELTRGPQNHLLMPATLNGQSLIFLLDTAIDLNLLQSSLATRLSLQLSGQYAQAVGQSFPLAESGDLRAGNVRLGKESFALYRTSQLGGPIPGLNGSRADGILGLQFLRRRQAVINCRSRHLYLKVDQSHALDAGSVTRAGYTRIPLEEDRRGYITVPCRIRGRPGRLRLDTGAFLTGVDDNAAHSLGLEVSPSRATFRGLDGVIRPVELTLLNDLEIGGVRIAPQKFAVLDVFGRRKTLRVFTGINRLEYYEPHRIAPGDTIFGLLGNELLDQRRAIIDFGSMSLFLK